MNPQDGLNSVSQKEVSPLGRFATSEQVADAVAYFVSRLAGFTIGTRLGVDGGRNAWGPGAHGFPGFRNSFGSSGP